MVFLENLKSELEALRPIISELHDVYDIERSQERIAELHEKPQSLIFGTTWRNRRRFCRKQEILRANWKIQ